MPIYAFEGKRPIIASSAYVSPTATIVGNVTVGEQCYIGFGAIIRGDYGSIRIGDKTAVEEGVIIHARPHNQTLIEDLVTIGHGAMIHNAIIREGAVIGMRAVVSDDAEVGAGSIVAEMGLVKSGQVIPPHKVAIGSPVRVISNVSDRHQNMTKHAKKIYVELAERYTSGGLVEIDACTQTSAMPMIPIGAIHTRFSEAKGTPIQGALTHDEPGEVVLAPSYVEGLADLEGFSHLVLIYAFDRTTESRLRVKPYLDKEEKGVFATRSPSRPNPIGMTVVRLVRIDGRRLLISGVDMLDGTPLIDIKPYIPDIDHPEDVKCGWLEKHLPDLKKEKKCPVADDRFHSPKS